MGAYNPHPAALSPLVGKYFVATVVQNKDPLNLYRLQVRVPELHADVEDEHLPWASIVRPILRGAEANLSFYSIPVKNSRVLVVFDAGDPMSPLVVGELVDGSSIPAGNGDTDRFGWQDEYGNMIYVFPSLNILYAQFGNTQIKVDNLDVLVTTSNVTVAADTMTANVTNSCYVNCPDVELGSSGLGSGNGVVRYSDLQAAITGHTHADAQGGTTGGGSGPITASGTVKVL